MNSLQILLNLLALIALGIFLGWVIVKSNPCSAFNPASSCTQEMQENL